MVAEKNTELIYDRFNTLVHLYEHHIDLFWKWVTLYSTVIGALIVFFVEKKFVLPNGRLFPFLIALASLVISYGCFIMWSWLKELEGVLKDLSSDLGIPYRPNLLGKRMTIAALILTVSLSIGCLLYSVIFVGAKVMPQEPAHAVA
jgi:hypothetical protein